LLSKQSFCVDQNLSADARWAEWWYDEIAEPSRCSGNQRGEKGETMLDSFLTGLLAKEHIGELHREATEIRRA
jgi:hypothetical protein